MKAKLLLASALLATTTLAMAEQPIAIVNGQNISKKLQDYWVAELVANGGQDTPEVRAQILDNLVAGVIVEQEAKKMDVEKQPKVQFALQYAKFRILQDVLTQEYLKKHPITEKQIKAYYDEQVAKLDKKQYEVRHILVNDKKTADELLAKIKKGESFELLAKQHSKDEGAKDTAGYLGWYSPSSFVKPFASALEKMKKGELSKAPVQTEFGWHIIRVEDTRDQPIPSFDSVKKQITLNLEQQQRNQYIENLLNKAKVEYPAVPLKK